MESPEPVDFPLEELDVTEESWHEERRSRRWGWVVPTLAILAILGWTGFFGWVHQGEILARATPEQWSNWIVAWAVPVLLVVSLWLLALRNSRREASRFSETALSLSRESARLEERLSVVNRELSLAREFLAAQSRDLEALGRIASERISEHAGRLQELIADNGQQVETIGRVSETARDNMERLRSDLPVISNSARDVSNQIGHAGDVAQGHLQSLVEGFNRLNQFGEASERQVVSLQERIDQALSQFETQLEELEQAAGERFSVLEQQSKEFRARLDGREVEALASLRRQASALDEELTARGTEIQGRTEREIVALRERVAMVGEEGRALLDQMRSGREEAAESWATAIEDFKTRLGQAINDISRIDAAALDQARRRLSALSEEASRVDATMTERTEAFEEAIARHRESAEARESEAVIALENRLAKLDQHVRERQEEHLAHVSGLAERGDAMAARLGELAHKMTSISAQGSEAGNALQEATANLAASLAESRQELERNSALIARLTDESVRLLELVRAGSEHTQRDLPRALADASTVLDGFESRIRDTRQTISEAVNKGAVLAEHAAAAQQAGTGAIEQFAALDSQIVDATRAHAERLAELEASLNAIAEKSDAIAQTARATLGEALEGMTERFAEVSAVSIERALREHADSAIEELQESARKASEVSREAAIQLRDQFAAVNELAGNLEHRVAYARQRAEEQVDNDFARRMALITESLNSSAIDISKAFDTEVTDSAWASYLRGDRGIFTRRAVRLLESQQTREISEIYGEDGDFRETVNRYIHDFEAMLRSVLSTRDGHALGVTLLSSDPGKLYVALAQAIERLRD
ncbi:ATPase [Altererythrobacter salegens]|uniref:ATPase n=1 Tax=Croceibacterium salegens TaxID=1737568 RepID=A0A6I4SW67_9SPHN|nr:ATPase [Croceibacterium salegens]MXO59589.1 ATPase [Croceibacterium salegens]